MSPKPQRTKDQLEIEPNGSPDSVLESNVEAISLEDDAIEPDTNPGRPE